MKTLHRNKKRLNANTLNESDYFVLSYEELLKVNGRGSTPSATPGPTGPTGGGYGTCAGGGAITSSSTIAPDNPNTVPDQYRSDYIASFEKEPQQASFGYIPKEYQKTMQQYKNSKDQKIKAKDSEMNGDNKFSLVGCVMTADSMVASAIAGKEISLKDVNDKYDKNKDGLMSQTESFNCIKASAKSGQTVTTEHIEGNITKAKLDEIARNDLLNGTTTYIVARADNVHGTDSHQFVIEGYHINEKGQVEFNYVGTSDNDKGRTYILGTPTQDQSKTYSVTKLETYTVSYR